MESVFPVDGKTEYIFFKKLVFFPFLEIPLLFWKIKHKHFESLYIAQFFSKSLV